MKTTTKKLTKNEKTERLVTKYDSKGTFYFYYDNGTIKEVKTAKIKKYHDLVILAGASKDNVICLYCGTNNRVFVKIASAYSTNDKLYYMHKEATRLVTDLYTDSLKKCLHDFNLTWNCIKSLPDTVLNVSEDKETGIQKYTKFTTVEYSILYDCNSENNCLEYKFNEEQLRLNIKQHNALIEGTLPQDSIYSDLVLLNLAETANNLGIHSNNIKVAKMQEWIKTNSLENAIIAM